MRSLVVGLLAAAIGIPGAANQAQPDPDRKVAGGGTLPAGWQARLDRANANLVDVKFIAAGTSLQFTTGPAAIFYKPEQTATGAYRVAATFTQVKASAHPEAYGLIIGGSDLAGTGQQYTYFLLRQDGRYLIKKRAGTETPTLVDWTDHAAVKKAGADGAMTNALSIAVGPDEVRFLVNGTEVAKLPRSQVDADGIVGLRVNHNLDLKVDGFGVQTGSSN